MQHTSSYYYSYVEKCEYWYLELPVGSPEYSFRKGFGLGSLAIAGYIRS